MPSPQFADRLYSMIKLEADRRNRLVIATVTGSIDDAEVARVWTAVEAGARSIDSAIYDLTGVTASAISPAFIESFAARKPLTPSERTVFVVPESGRIRDQTLEVARRRLALQGSHFRIVTRLADAFAALNVVPASLQLEDLLPG